MASNNSGAYIPTTNVWDVNEIYSTEVTSPKFKELLVRLYQNLNVMSMGINNRDAGMYDTNEFVCGQQFFSNPALTSASTTTPTPRNVFRKVVNFGALPNTASKSAAHGITTTTGLSFTRVYGVATKPSPIHCLPFPRPDDGVYNYISLDVDGTNVNVKTGANLSGYTTAYVILEYIKN